MLLPKGAPEGVQFDLFVMISNFDNDSVGQEFDEYYFAQHLFELVLNVLFLLQNG